MSNNSGYSFILLTLFYFPINSGWVPDWVANKCLGAHQSDQEIQQAIVQWRSQSLSAQEGLLHKYNQCRENDLQSLLAKMKIPPKIFHHEVKNAISMINLSGTTTISDKVPIPMRPVIAYYFQQNPTPEIKKITCSADTEGAIRYSDKHQGYVIRLNPHEALEDIPLTLAHEIGHAKHHDPIIQTILDKYASSTTTEKWKPLANRRSQNAELFADAYALLHNKCHGKQQKKLYSITHSLARHNWRPLFWKEIALSIISKATVLNMFNNVYSLHTSQILPLSIAIPIALSSTPAFFFFEGYHYFKTGESHPSDHGRWRALKRIENFLKIEQEMKKNV